MQDINFFLSFVKQYSAIIGIRKKLIVFLFCCIFLKSMAVGNVCIYDKTGERLSFTLDNKAKVTVSSEDIVIDVGDKQVLFPLSDYVTFMFEKDPSNINTIEYNSKKGIVVEIEGEELILKNLPPMSIVRIYSLSGVLMDSAQSNTEGTLILNLGKMSKQVVIVQTVYKNFKISL